MSFVLRAAPGAFTEEYIRYHLPQERGWSYVHATQLSQGIQMTWPDAGSTSHGQWWKRVRKRFDTRH